MFNFSFYRFIKCSIEMIPECIVKFPRDNFTLIMEYIINGLQINQDKDDLLCNVKDRFEQEVLNSLFLYLKTF